MFGWLAGEFVGAAAATPAGAVLESEAGDGGAAMAANLASGPAGPDCIDFDNNPCVVGGTTGCGREGGVTGPDGTAVADGIAISAGLGTVTSGRAGSGTTVAVAGTGAFVSAGTC